MIPHSDSPNWIIAPAANCVRYAAQETRNAATLHRAITVLAGLRPFLHIGKQKLSELGKPTAQIDVLLKEQDGHETEAKALLNAECSPVNSHALIGLWCAVEVAVEDTIVLILMNDEFAPGTLRRSDLKTKGVQSGPLSEPASRKLFRSLESQARKDRAIGTAYAYLLGALGLDLEVDDSVLECIGEVNLVRNCILHRAGILDGSVHSEAPQLAEFENKVVQITNERYQHYYDAISKFAIALLSAASASRHVVAK